MLNRAPPSLQQIIGRVPAVAKFGVRLYLVLALVQFVAGFVVGGALPTPRGLARPLSMQVNAECPRHGI